MSESIWDHIPSGGPGPGDKIKKRPKTRAPKAGERLKLMPLEDTVGWYLTHYHNDRTKPCLKARCWCQQADKPAPTRWVGYLLAKIHDSSEVVLAMLTPNCAATCPDVVQNQTSLRGSQMVLTRTGHAQGQVDCYVHHGFYPLRVVPVLPYTHREQLLRVWFPGVADYADLEALFRFESYLAPLTDEETAKEQGQWREESPSAKDQIPDGTSSPKKRGKKDTST